MNNRDQELWKACTGGDVDDVMALLAKGYDVNARLDVQKGKGKTPLHGAVTGSDNLPLVTALLDRGADPNAVDARQQTVLGHALRGSYSATDHDDLAARLAIMQLLVARGADPKVREEQGKSLIHVVAASGSTDDEDADKALLGKGHPWLDWCLALGLDINARDDFGKTPLHTAVAHADTIMTQHLLARGADARLVAANGKSTIHYAFAEENIPFLVAAGADVNAADPDGNTALHEAVPRRFDLAEVLIAHGANRQLTNHAGQTPFVCAKGDVKWEELLRYPGVVSKRDAVRAIDAKLASDPDNAALHAQRGAELIALGERSDAIDAYRRATELDDRNAVSWLALGSALLAQNDDDASAVEPFGKAIELDDTLAAAYAGRARILRSMRRYEAAIADGRRALALGIDEEQRELLTGLIGSAETNLQFAAMNPADLTELWYGVTLPLEYRAFLEHGTYRHFANMRPRRLPTYGENVPPIEFVVGRSTTGEDGEGCFDPSVDSGLEHLRLPADRIEMKQIGELQKDELFSGAAEALDEDGALDKYLPFAVLGDDGQSLAIDISPGGGCAISMYDHESCRFTRLAGSMGEFLASLLPDAVRDAILAAERASRGESGDADPDDDDDEDSDDDDDEGDDD